MEDFNVGNTLEYLQDKIDNLNNIDTDEDGRKIIQKAIDVLYLAKQKIVSISMEGIDKQELDEALSLTEKRAKELYEKVLELLPQGKLNTVLEERGFDGFEEKLEKLNYVEESNHKHSNKALSKLIGWLSPDGEN